MDHKCTSRSCSKYKVIDNVFIWLTFLVRNIIGKTMEQAVICGQDFHGLFFGMSAYGIVT
jgi:hypothetical protein